MTVRSRTWTVASPGTAAALVRPPGDTERPTISEASSVSVDVGSALPTTLPRRMTVIRSATARTSRSLCVMKTIDVPDSLSWRMIAISSSVSCGVSTAVGSSRMRTLACRDSALMISTRCWTPTGRSSMYASGSTWNPNRSEISLTRRRASARSMQPAAADGLVAEHHVLRDGEHRDEHEVLVDHADAGGHRVAGAGERHGRVVDEDLAAVGVVQPVEHVHQRALAGAVLPEQRVDLARLDDEVDVVVGDQRPEGLGDALQLQLHRSSPSTSRLSSDTIHRPREVGAGQADGPGRWARAVVLRSVRQITSGRRRTPPSMSPEMIDALSSSSFVDDVGGDLRLEVVERRQAEALVLQRADVRRRS